MRLTLRTLLSYLDDTLEPAQAKLIGQKVSESEQARELMERISQVTRRRRLTTPPTSGPGGLDPNTMAEYLDNEVTSEQSAEVCLASDVHLAEVAACHQILTLVLGEPALVPPSAKQRMYGLVKGPEAIPFRKPSRADSRVNQDLSSEISGDADETLRLGVGWLRGTGGWRNQLLLLGGGAIAVGLLVLALVQLMSAPGAPETEKPTVQVARQDDESGKVKKTPTDEAAEIAPVPTPPPTAPKKSDQKSEEGSKKPSAPLEVVKTPPIEEALAPEVPFGDPDTRQVPIGRFVPPGPKDLPAMLLQYDRKEWRRLAAAKPEVISGEPLVSLPGSRTNVRLHRGVQLTLWGNLPEISGAPLFESRVEVFPQDKLNVDMVLERGRILLNNDNGERPAYVRVRFENPKTGKQDFFDINLLTKDTSVLVERWCYIPDTEPFYPDPKDRARIGPMARVNCAVLAGSAKIKSGILSYGLSAPPGHFFLTWDSSTGVHEPRPGIMPPQYADNPELPKEMEKGRNAALKAEVDLAENMRSKAVDVALAETLNGSDPVARRLALRCYEAIDDLNAILDRFEDDSASADVRNTCIEVLRGWIALRRDNAYELLDILKKRYSKGGAAQKIVELLHYLPKQRLDDPLTYETLIDDLANPLLPIRELSAWHLYRIAPAGQKINYSPTASPAAWTAAQNQWFILIPRGQLPRPPMPPTAVPKKS
jgi:hypothetical protein